MVGQPITLSLDATERPRRESRSDGPSRGSDFGRGRRGVGRGFGRGGRGPPPQQQRSSNRPSATQEDLDKELDDFMSGPPPSAENGVGEEMALD